MSYSGFFSRLQNGSDVRGAAIAAGDEARTLTPGLAVFIAASFGQWLAGRTGKEAADLRIGVGHDSRVTAEEIKGAVLWGIGGSRAYDCGLITTPAMFQSTILPGSCFDGAVMITASHLPFNRNGMKFFTKDGGLDAADLKEILARAAELAEQYGTPDEEEFVSAEGFRPEGGEIQPFDMRKTYADAMKELISGKVNPDAGKLPLEGLHIVVDSGNGASGFFATDILAPLGADISGSVFLEPDGMFPNHVPNPENETAMKAVRKAVLDAGADLGVIFDCDGDRAAVVFADGTEVNRNSLIALLSVIVSEEFPGSTIVTDSVTSDELTLFLEQTLKLRHLRFRRGYRNVIRKGIELNRSGETCELAIETSGHGAFRSNHFSDDGAYIAAVIICRLAMLRKKGRRLEDDLAELRQPAESAEYRFRIEAEDFRAYGEQALEDFRAFAQKDPRFRIVEPNYEGIRIAFDDDEIRGWLLIRMSLHDPVMPLNVETAEEGGCRKALERLNPFLAEHGLLRLA